MAGRKPKSDEFTLALARRLRAARQQRGWTQKDLADRVGVLRVMIVNYEGGFHHPPLPTLSKLSRTLGVSVDFLLHGQAPSSNDFQDRELLEFVAKVDKLDYRAKFTLKEMVLALLARYDVESKPADKERVA